MWQISAQRMVPCSVLSNTNNSSWIIGLWNNVPSMDEWRVYVIPLWINILFQGHLYGLYNSIDIWLFFTSVYIDHIVRITNQFLYNLFLKILKNITLYFLNIIDMNNTYMISYWYLFCLNINYIAAEYCSRNVKMPNFIDHKISQTRLRLKRLICIVCMYKKSKTVVFAINQT